MTLCRAGAVSTEKGPWEGLGPHDHIITFLWLSLGAF